MIGVEDDSVIIATWNSEMWMWGNFLRKAVRGLEVEQRRMGAYYCNSLSVKVVTAFFLKTLKGIKSQ